MKQWALRVFQSHDGGTCLRLGIASKKRMLETVFILLLGLIPGLLSSYLITRRVRRYTQRRYDIALHASQRVSNPYLIAQDYRYVEGLGYIIGDLTCQFNARSPHLRCAINPSGPCKGCPHYESIRFPELETNFIQRTER